MASATSSPSRAHIWILVLLVWILAFVLFGVGYQLWKQQEPPTLTPEEIAALCPETVTPAADNDAPVSCPEEAPREVVGTTDNPGFAYPDGWHVVSQDTMRTEDAAGVATPPTLMRTIHINNEPIFYCTECDGPRIAVSVTTAPKDALVNKGTATTSTAAYLATFEDEVYSDVVTETRAVDGGMLTTIRGTVDALYTGDFEILFFEGRNMASIVRHEADGDLDEEWDIIKTSLDFSTID